MDDISLGKRLYINILAGGSAGIIMDLVNFPLDTIKTRLQVFLEDEQISVKKSTQEFLQWSFTLDDHFGTRSWVLFSRL